MKEIYKQLYVFQVWSILTKEIRLINQGKTKGQEVTESI